MIGVVRKLGWWGWVLLAEDGGPRSAALVSGALMFGLPTGLAVFFLWLGANWWRGLLLAFVVGLTLSGTAAALYRRVQKLSAPPEEDTLPDMFPTRKLLEHFAPSGRTSRQRAQVLGAALAVSGVVTVTAAAASSAPWDERALIGLGPLLFIGACAEHLIRARRQSAR